MPSKKTANIMVTVPTDMADRMKAAGLRPSAIFKAALSEALEGHDPGSLGSRLAALERTVRAHSRALKSA